MADDKTNRGEPDRSRVSASEDYEIRYFADKFKLMPDEVRELIKRYGSDRATLEAEAEKRTRVRP